MKYKKFIIDGYRGINDLTEINIVKESIIPIIGKNESGKTTCLEAILAFDFHNDNEHNGKHLQNVQNLYSTLPKPVIISAEVDLGAKFSLEDMFKSELSTFKDEFLKNNPADAKSLKGFAFDLLEDAEDNVYRFKNWEYVRAIQILGDAVINTHCLLISRNLLNMKYFIPELTGKITVEADDAICRALVRQLPYSLYFDDFRDRLEEHIYITKDTNNSNYSTWIPYLNEIFHVTNAGYDIYELPEKHSSQRKSILKEVQNTLNDTLVADWSNYQFEKSGDIRIEINYQDGSDLPYISFNIVETITVDGKDQERYFEISDRSKGFYWYLNFMIKLHYNPSKRNDNDEDTLYLLDEPGSYLHTFALNKLAAQLKKLSVRNKVIYCTHSPNLLDPDCIPINSIRIAEKVKNGKIVLKRLDHKGLVRPKRNSAYQPVFDALEVRPQLMEFEQDNIVLVEGIYDYYAFRMFGSDNVNYFPCVSASSITNQIPYMIFLGKKYLALWDNDNEGRSRLKKAVEQFGEAEGHKFLTLPTHGNAKETRLEEYFDEGEMLKYNKSEKLNKEAFCSFVLKLFYSPDRNKIIKRNFAQTLANFKALDSFLLEKLSL
jgi:predicted ATPase